MERTLILYSVLPKDCVATGRHFVAVIRYRYCMDVLVDQSPAELILSETPTSGLRIGFLVS
jgi:hypothetical protein